MYDRARYKEIHHLQVPTTGSPAGFYKWDGGNFWLSFDHEGNPKYISRRPSVKGGYPDRTEALPHLQKKIPELAGHIYNVELVHTGFHRNNAESHSQLSGILNSLPPRAIATQQAIGPVRAVLHNVINPKFSTYRQKLDQLKKVERLFGNPDLVFANEPHEGFAAIHKLIRETKDNNREGIIILDMDKHEDENVRLKIKHKLQYNLRVVGIVQEIDKDGKPKESMGALRCEDAKGREVALVGTGFSRAQRIDAWKNPSSWKGKLIQVETMGVAERRLRAPVYNGDADGDCDVVPIKGEPTF